MIVWQTFAGDLALFLGTGIVVMVWRVRLVSMLVIAVLTVGVPASGFIAYAVAPGPAPDERFVVALALVLYASLLLALPFAIRRRRQVRSVYQLSRENRLAPQVLLGRLAFVLWLTAMLLVLHMAAWAVANLVVNLVWTAIWIPRRMRKMASGASLDIGTRPEKVFEFLTDLSRWPLYRETELVSVTPPGRLANGTEYVVRVPIPEALKRAMRSPQMESRYRVSDVVPGRSYSVTLEDGRVRTSTTIEPIAVGSRVTRRIEMRFPFAQAAHGAMITAWRSMPSRRDGERKLLTRVKAILETPGD